MKRFLSISLIVCLVLMSAFVLTGCSVKELPVGSSSVKNEGNKVIVISNDGNAIITTTYVYTNNVISSVKAVYDYKQNPSILEETYNNMISEPIVVSMYKNIEKKDNTIELDFADVLYDAYKNMTQEELYSLMKQSYNIQ